MALAMLIPYPQERPAPEPRLCVHFAAVDQWTRSQVRVLICFSCGESLRRIALALGNRQTHWRAEIDSGSPVMAARVATDEEIGSAFRRDVLRQSTAVMSTDPLAPLERT